MTAPITGIELTIGTAGAQRGAAEWKRSMQEIQGSARQVQGELQGLQRESRQAAQAQTAIRESARVVAQTQTAAAAATRNWSASMTQLRGPLVGVTSQVVGVNGTVGSLVGILGQLSFGSPVVVGVLAAIAAIAAGFKFLGRDSKEGEAALDELLKKADRLAQQQREASGQALAVDLDTIRALAAQAEQEHARLAQLAKNQEEFFGRIPSATRKALNEAAAELFKFREAEAAFTREEDAQRAKAALEAERQREEAERRREELHRREIARLKEIARLVQENNRIQREFLTGTGFTPTVTPVRGPALSGEGRDTLTRRAAAEERLNASGLELIDTSARLKLALDEIREQDERRTDELRRQAEAVEQWRQDMISLTRAGTDFVVTMLRLPPAMAANVDAFGDLLDALSAKNPVAAVSAGLRVLGGVLGGDGGRADRAFAESVRQFQQSVRDFASGTRDAYAAAEQGLRDTFDSLVRQAASAYGISTAGRSPEEIRAAAQARVGRSRGSQEAQAFLAEFDRIFAILNERLADVARERERDLGYLREDLAVRALVAEGRNAEAEAIRLEIENARELAAIKDQFGDAFTDELAAEIKRVQVLEDEAAALKKANEEAQRRTDFFTDLAIREAAALGDDAEAGRLRREWERQREIAAALAAGFDDAAIAQLKYVQGLEEQATAQAEATAAIEAAIEAAKAEARAFDDLHVRRLRARGEGLAADEIQFYLQQQREIEDAIEQGRSPSFVAELQTVQAEERAWRRQQMQQQQQEDFDRAFGTSGPSFTDTAPSVNLAVGVSESTASALRGLNQAQLIELREHTALLGLVARNTGALARARGIDLDAIETGIVQRIGEAEHALGFNLGNV